MDNVGIVDTMVKSKPKSLTLADKIMDAVVNFHMKGYCPDQVVINPHDLKPLLEEPKFLPAYAYPASKSVQGIGKIFGVKVHIDPKVREGTILVKGNHTWYEREEEWNPSRRY